MTWNPNAWTASDVAQQAQMGANQAHRETESLGKGLNDVIERLTVLEKRVELLLGNQLASREALAEAGLTVVPVAYVDKAMLHDLAATINVDGYNAGIEMLQSWGLPVEVGE